MNNPNVVMIHGSGGLSPDDLWYPETKYEIERLGIEVVSAAMPDSVAARMSEWIPFMKDVLRIDENSIIVGHSSGAVAAMRYAEYNLIYGSILVAVSHTDLGVAEEVRSCYFNRPWDWNAIKANQRWIVQFAAPNDPLIPINEPRYINSKLGSEYHEKLRGHYQDIVFPEVAEEISRKMQRA